MEQAIANLESDNSELRVQLQQSKITLQKKDIELSAYLQAEQDYEASYISEKEKEAKLETKYKALQLLYSNSPRILQPEHYTAQTQDEKTKQLISAQKKLYQNSNTLNTLALATQGAGYKITISQLSEELHTHQRLLEEKFSHSQKLSTKISDLEAEILP
jgi:hypothetical protein